MVERLGFIAAQHEVSLNITPVILAGGYGERLWPLSTPEFPKPFIRLHGTATSLFQDTLLRVADRELFQAPLILCNQRHFSLVQMQLAEIGIEDYTIIAEPMSCNTAPALAFAALHLAKQQNMQPMLILPSDHHLADVDVWKQAVMTGMGLAEAGNIVTFAMEAVLPETGYGYIRFGEAIESSGAYRIQQFVEKPDATTAVAMIADGNVGLNSGMFLLTAQTALAALETYVPDLLACCRAAFIAGTQRSQYVLPDAAPMEHCPILSIDYAIMEYATNGAVIPLCVGWADLGSFTSLMTRGYDDGRGNMHSGNVVLHDSQQCQVYAQDTQVIAVGLDSIMVVATPEAILIAPKDRMHELRPLQQQAQKKADLLPLSVVETRRPWGHYCLLDSNQHYQVKRLHLSPGSKISLQSHQHRSEHWVVIQGRATVTQHDQTFFLEANQSTYIPAGVIHRLENSGSEELIVIEVQTGDYLGEDDIVRFEDSYNRV